MQLVAGQLVANRFQLLRLLGRGGMGSVWLANHTELQIPCAVKFIEGDNASNQEYRARFSREARAAAQLRSPHVVQVLDTGEWEGIPYLAMELLEGQELSVRIKAGKLGAVECVEIVGQISRALTKAHLNGIVHRDLKPDNIFLTRDDDRVLAKILDFGIAKQTNSIEGSSTKTGALLGTPYYMSPEQAHGSKQVDQRSDLWSLAVIVYECMTGTKPFLAMGFGELLMLILSAPLPVPSHAAPELPPSFDAWWARAAARAPEERFQTARELATELAHALGVPLGPGSQVSLATPSNPGSNPGMHTPGLGQSNPFSPSQPGFAQSNPFAPSQPGLAQSNPFGPSQPGIPQPNPSQPGFAQSNPLSPSYGGASSPGLRTTGGAGAVSAPANGSAAKGAAVALAAVATVLVCVIGGFLLLRRADPAPTSATTNATTAAVSAPAASTSTVQTAPTASEVASAEAAPAASATAIPAATPTSTVAVDASAKAPALPKFDPKRAVPTAAAVVPPAPPKKKDMGF